MEDSLIPPSRKLQTDDLCVVAAEHREYSTLTVVSTILLQIIHVVYSCGRFRHVAKNDIIYILRVYFSALCTSILPILTKVDDATIPVNYYCYTRTRLGILGIDCVSSFDILHPSAYDGDRRAHSGLLRKHALIEHVC